MNKGDYVWFVIPQELSFYPVVIGARVESVNYDDVTVIWTWPHPRFPHDRLYTTKKEAKIACIEVLKQKVARMKSRIAEMNNTWTKWEENDAEWCGQCDICDIDEMSLDKPCQEWNQKK